MCYAPPNFSTKLQNEILTTDTSDFLKQMIFFKPFNSLFSVTDRYFDTSLTSSWVQIPGPGCSKLTTSLVNDSLKFQTLISQICQYFLLKNERSFCSAKASLIFSTKNFSVFGYKVAKHLRS